MVGTVPHNGQMKLFTGTANPGLGQEVADFLGITLGGVDISRFAKIGRASCRERV